MQVYKISLSTVKSDKQPDLLPADFSSRLHNHVDWVPMFADRSKTRNGVVAAAVSPNGIISLFRPACPHLYEAGGSGF